MVDPRANLGRKAPNHVLEQSPDSSREEAPPVFIPKRTLCQTRSLTLVALRHGLQIVLI